MKGSLYTTVFSGILGVVCSLLLAGASETLKPYQEANKKAEEAFNILRVLGVPFEEDASAKELVALAATTVIRETRGDLKLFRYVSSDGGVKAVAVSFAGQGLWGPIKGFLALEPDMRTIRGITFHEQEETPGLGGEIGAEWFRSQFVGKSIVDEEGRPGIRIVTKKPADGINEVDAITGATMTCRKVEAMVNAIIEQLAGGQTENVQ